MRFVSRLIVAIVFTVVAFSAWASVWEDWYAEESARISPFSDQVRREGDNLILRIGTEGVKRVLTNPPTYCDGPIDCVVYIFEGYLEPAHSYILRMLFYEWERYLLVDEYTGSETMIAAFPHADPTGTRFIAVHADESGMTLNGFEMWMLSNEGSKLEWRFEARDVFEFKSWTDSRNVELLRQDIDDHVNSEIVPARLTDTGAGWRLSGEGIEDIMIPQNQ